MCARLCVRRQRPALSCSHQHVSRVTPTGNSLHTSPPPWQPWFRQGLAARPFEGKGQLFFPHVRPRTPWGARRSRFRRDVSQSHRSARRLRRCEPPPPQNAFPRPDVSSGGLPNSSSGRPFRHGRSPRAVRQRSCPPHLWPRPSGHRQAVPLLPRKTCAGSAAVRTALPAPARAALPSKLCIKAVHALLHDAAVSPSARRWTRRRPSSGPSL